MSENITFVSLGPGEPELITLKALKWLQEATTIYCPGTTSKIGKVLSRSFNIMQSLGIATEKIQIFDVPMSKERTPTKKDYEQIAKKIVAQWQDKRQSIAVCAQGDASFYSSVYYISELLTAQNIPIRRIAGIPAFIAAGTLANLHIVKQKEWLSVIPGVVTLEELRKECSKDTTVIIMKTPQSQEVIKKAIAIFQDSVFHYFENVGVRDKEFYTSDKEVILNREFPYFSLLIIQNKDR